MMTFGRSYRSSGSGGIRTGDGDLGCFDVVFDLCGLDLGAVIDETYVAPD